MDAPHLFCLGFGYSALVLAKRLSARGVLVSGTARSADKAARLEAEGFAVQSFDEDVRLDGVTHMLMSAPPDERGDPVLRRHGEALRASGAQFRWAGYLSTTAVYGDRKGEFVDEDSALRPSGARGQARVDAEAAWRASGLPMHVFRLAGIYGPGRNALISLKSGTAKRIDKPDQLFSRIHVEDIASVLDASMASPNPGRVYNVCDDEPANPAVVIEYAAALLGTMPPPLVKLEDAGLSALGRSFYEDSKRVRNARIRSELKVALRYPSYRDGLKALLSTLNQARRSDAV